jgi:hypothetical protein
VIHRCSALTTLALAVLLLRSSNAREYKYAVPEQLHDGWPTANLRDENFDAALIEDMMERIRSNEYKNIHSVLLIKNGKLIVEEYFPGREEDGHHRAYDRKNASWNTFGNQEREFAFDWNRD